MKILKAACLGLAAVGCFFISAQNANAGAVVLTWDENTETDLAGYRIYYDTVSHAGTCPEGYADFVDVAEDANVGYWLNNLTPGQTYYFQVTALDTSDNESGCSTAPGEVSKVVATNSLRSDVNYSSTTTSADALLTLRKSLIMDMTNTAWRANRITGDANCDSDVTSADAMLILKYSMGLPMGATTWCD